MTAAVRSWLRVALVGRNPRRTLVRIVALVLLVFGLRAYVLLPIQVKGPSMLPTFQDHGVNFVNRLAYWRSAPRRGDVVALQLADTGIRNPSVMLMKRIIGLPGETVAFHEGRVLINGEPLPEPYVKNPCDWEIPPVKLGWDQYYVVGDNRDMPESLHEKGRAHRGQIVGKILLCRNLFAS